MISLVSATEWFLSRTIHLYFDKFPDAVEGKEKAFSLEDLKTFGSIDQAKSFLIDSYVEQVLRGSFDDWLDFLKRRMKLNMGYLEPHKARLAEIFQRRNIVVHNGSVVNSIYIAKVPPELGEGLRCGDLVRVSRTYLDVAISLFERCFLLIAAELWKKIEPSSAERGPALIDITYNHLLAERWDIAEGLSYFTVHDAQLPELDRLIATVNYWQSLKWQSRFEEIRTDVETADFSAKDEVFRLAQLVLLDDIQGFFGMLPHALASEALPHAALMEWPLFREMRKCEQYAQYLTTTEESRENESASIRKGNST